MLFKKKSVSLKKLVAATLLFSFCNLSISIAEPITITNDNKIEMAPVKLSGSTTITTSKSKINLSLRDSDVKQVLRMFANKVGLNIIFHSSVEGKVTLDLINTNINDAFELVLDTCELTYYKDGSTIIVASKNADTKMSFSKKNLTAIPVKYVMAQDVANFLNKNVYGANMIGLSNKEIATVNAINNEVLIFGSDNDVEAAKKVIKKFDVKPLDTTYSLSHTTPKEMADLICNAYLGSMTGSVSSSSGSGSSDSSSDPISTDSAPTGFASDSGSSSGSSSGSGSSSSVTNIQLGGGKIACTISGSTDGGAMAQFSNYKTTIAYFPQLGTVGLYGGSTSLSQNIGDFIKEHDKKQRMAYLEMNVVELDETGSKEFNNTWSMLTPFGTLAFNGEKFSIGADIFTDDNGLKFFPAGTNGYTALSYTLSTIITHGNGRTITNPKIMVTNGQKSTLDMTRDYIESVDLEFSETTGSLTSTPISEKTYNIGNDLGLKIQIVPFISDSGYVSLNIVPEYSVIPGDGEIKATDPSTKEKYTAATLIQRRNLDLKNIRIKDGETMVLAGLIIEDENQDDKKVPILGDLPLIGFLFRGSSNTKEKHELVIMITPHIIYDKEDKKIENI